jgi:hypothetical protein
MDLMNWFGEKGQNSDWLSPSNMAMMDKTPCIPLAYIQYICITDIAWKIISFDPF